MLIDSHAHVHFEDFKGEIPQVVERARQAGVKTIINIGTDLESSRQVVKLAQEQTEFYAAVGIHPHEASKGTEADLKEIRLLAAEKKVVAIGEIGLDYYYKHSPKEVQVQRLRDQILLAHEVGLPLIIHCRDAPEECLQVLDDTEGWKRGGVFHCFTGDPATAERIIEKGFYVSFSGIVTFKKATELREVAKKIPDDKFLIETDAPYLAPVPFRGKRNEPAYVRQVAAEIALIRKTTLEKIAAITTENTKNLFRSC